VAGGEGDDGGGTRGGGPGVRGGRKRLAIRPRPLVWGLTAVAGGGGRRIGWRWSRHVAAMAARTKILKRFVGKQFIQSLFSYIRPGYIHSGYNRDHGGTTEPERSRNVKLKRTCHPVFVLDLTQNDLLGVG